VHRSRSPGCSRSSKLDEASIVAGLLHDAIEDTLATPDEVKDLFGEEIFTLSTASQALEVLGIEYTEPGREAGRELSQDDHRHGRKTFASFS